MIQLKGVSREWPEFAIRDITLAVKNGEYLVIAGPTGAGKTLLLELILGIYRPDRGSVWMGGTDVTDVPPERRGIGMVYQDYVLFPHLDVSRNIAFGLRYRRIPSNESDVRVHRTAKLLGIEHLLHRYPETLSGGEKQRVAIGRALITEPRVLLLDEPLSALDHHTARRLRREIHDLNRKEKLTIVHVTHDLNEARAFGGPIALISEGQLKAMASAQDMLRRPPTVFAAHFFGCVNVFEASRRGDGVFCGPLSATVSTVAGSRFHIVVHSDQIRLFAPGEPDRLNLARGIVSSLSDEGSHVAVAIDIEGLPDVLTVFTNRHTIQALGLAPGSLTAADIGADIHVVCE